MMNTFALPTLFLTPQLHSQPKKLLRSAEAEAIFRARKKLAAKQARQTRPRPSGSMLRSLTNRLGMANIFSAKESTHKEAAPETENDNADDMIELPVLTFDIKLRDLVGDEAEIDLDGINSKYDPKKGLLCVILNNTAISKKEEESFGSSFRATLEQMFSWGGGSTSEGTRFGKK